VKAVVPDKSGSTARAVERGTFLDVFDVFLKLGLTSFGGLLRNLAIFALSSSSAGGKLTLLKGAVTVMAQN
jgi:hypothetical protein